MPRALLVEDDKDALHALANVVEGMGFSTITACTWEQARVELGRHSLDVVLIDVVLPGGSGIDLLLEIPGGRRPQVILMSGEEAVGRALSALPMQELHFVAKPVGLEALSLALRSARRRCGPTARPSRTRGNGRLLGASRAIESVRALIAKVAPHDLTVTIEGESGTGKELVARSIHESSPRRGRPFVALNCGAIPENLIDSELFGHEKGAFTGADRLQPGVFEQADGGTLFLDEITEMPFDLQVRLLRALETGCIRRLGGSREVRVDVRVVAAANRPFRQSVDEGRFREDLYHRLSIFPIVTPPLREHPEDIQQLADHFLDEAECSLRRRPAIAPGAFDHLRAYSWPGNVRQLRNVILRAVVVAEERIEPDCLPDFLLGEFPAAPPRPPSAGETIELSVGTSIAQAERRLIEATLRREQGDKRAAADRLGVSLRTLYNRLKEYGPAADGSEFE